MGDEMKEKPVEDFLGRGLPIPRTEGVPGKLCLAVNLAGGARLGNFSSGRLVGFNQLHLPPAWNGLQDALVVGLATAAGCNVTQ
jgi:hypothetical protein